MWTKGWAYRCRLLPAAAIALVVACLAGCTADAGGAPGTQPTKAVTIPLPSSSGVLLGAGDNSAGQLARSRPKDLRLPLPIKDANGRALHGIVAAAGGEGHTLALRSDGAVLAWGENDRGQLGNGTNRATRRPVLVRGADGGSDPLGDVVAVAADSNFSMALLSDGRVVTWGVNDAGQRGIGTTGEAPLTPTTVRDTQGAGPLGNVVGISADGRTELVVTRDGQALSWGENQYGELGSGTHKFRSLPGPVHGLYGAPALAGVRKVAMGGQHGLALLDDGRIVAWGRNSSGQLGDGTTTGQLTPKVVVGVGGLGELSGVERIAASESFSMALLRDGTLVGWGSNQAGQLGDGDRSEAQTKPTVVVSPETRLPLHGIAEVELGEAFTVALARDGSVYTWGAGSHGQLAAGPLVTRVRPGLVSALGHTKIAALGAGERHLLLVVRA